MYFSEALKFICHDGYLAKKIQIISLNTSNMFLLFANIWRFQKVVRIVEDGNASIRKH